MPVDYEYFYGPESESFSFYRVPRLLVTGEEYRQVSVEAKLLYGMLLDRMGLSARNGWYDGENRVYIYYTIEEICRDFNCGHDKAGKLLAELDSRKGIGLIEKVRQGQGRPARIYVKRFAKGEHRGKAKAGEDESRGLDIGKPAVKTSKKSKSRHLIFRGVDIEKSDASYTDNNYTEFSYNNLSINQEDIGKKMGEAKEEMDYPLSAEHYHDDPESPLELVGESPCTILPGRKLVKETPTMAEVKCRLSKYIDCGLDSIRNNKKGIQNIKACCLQLLCKVSGKIGPFYSMPGVWYGDCG